MAESQLYLRIIENEIPSVSISETLYLNITFL